MRHVRLRRALSTLAILIGLFGGLALAGYALFFMMADGLASPACGGGGCEDRLRADDAHYSDLLAIAGLGGVGLIAIGIVTKQSLAKQLAKEAPPAPAPLPVATVVGEHRDS